MAKAAFHKHQRVYVRPVGTWASIEAVKPHWVKDVEEPVRIAYDCGLGRDFTADELACEQTDTPRDGHWRLVRAKNKWQTPEECARHPHPGTFPVIVTDAMDWGGWRVPAAEYDRDPSRIEDQARMIAHAPRLFALAAEFARVCQTYEELPADLADLAKQCSDLVRDIEARPDGEMKRAADKAA